MSDNRKHLDEWLRQARQEAESKAYSLEQKRELLAYHAGRAWGYFFGCTDPDVMRHGWDVHRQINKLREALKP